MAEAIPYRGIQSLQIMFAIFSDERVAGALSRREIKDVARIFHVELPRRYITETAIAGRIRERIEQSEAIPTCDCAGRGTRWEKSDTGEPVLVYLDPELDTAYTGASDIIRARFEETASLTERLRFEFVADPAQCDILVDLSGEDSDGPNGTLGFTQYYRDGTEDLDVFGDTRWSVRLAMDQSERWTGGFLATVAWHEVLHAVGLAHINIPGNILQEYYAGEQNELGAEELKALFNLYGEAERIAA